MNRSSRWGVALLTCLLAAPQAARAWKPYTHNYTGDRILADLDADAAQVRLNGVWYDVDPRVAAAIRACPACYLAGTVGPDGFPDLAYGQGVVHPLKTGEWLGRLVDEAWAAQGDPRYSAPEREKILAWTYGFLTHAAGDVWGHTLVNEFAGGVFPGVADILTSPEQAAKAIRHILIEGVVGDATPGYDANPGRTVAPGGYGRLDGDVSEDATPGYAYDVPVAFVYDALVDEHFPTPWKDRADGTYQPPKAPVRGEYIEARGALVGGFLELAAGLEDFYEDDLPNPLDAALSQYDDTLAALRAVQADCSFSGGWDDVHDFFACMPALISLGWNALVDSAEAFAAAVLTVAEDLAYVVLDAYLKAWNADIRAGLQHWAELGLGTTRALFDAQTRRAVQNEECRWDGDESTQLRANCEADVGLGKVLSKQAEPFIYAHGLSMAGAPDVTGDILSVLDTVGDVVDDILGVLGLPFEPLREAKAELKEWIEDQIEAAISDAIGIDVEQLKEFLKKPSNYVCLREVQLPLPRLGVVTVPLFSAGEHERLDAYLGLSGTDHHDQLAGLPEGCGFLKDEVAFDPGAVAAIRDTIIMGKLALMTGPQLDALLGGLLGREIRTYAEHQNVLVKALDDRPPWLLLIDGDHGWRFDGLPVFGIRLPPDVHAGTGRMPLWESCVMRPAFRTLFQDWENPYAGRGPGPGVPLQNFPALFDSPSSDVVNDPAAPASRLVPGGTWLLDGDRYYVARDHSLSVLAEELEPARGFPPAQLGIERAVYTDPLLRPLPEAAAPGAPFRVEGPDGSYFVDYHAADPCHPFTHGDEVASDGEPEPVHTVEVVLDGTAPAVTCGAPPFGRTFTTDALSRIDFSAADAAVGLQGTSATLDGVLGAHRPVPVASGDPLDAYLLAPGRRTVAVRALDRLGNEGTVPCRFEVIVTASSLRANLARALAEGGLHDGLRRPLENLLDAAVKAHERGHHELERKLVLAFARVLGAHRCGKGDEPAVHHLALYAEWFVWHGRCPCGRDT